MSLMLAPHTEARLRAVAKQRGLPPAEALDTVLAEAQTDFDEAVAGIRVGRQDFAAGRWVSLEDYEAQVMAKRQARDAQRPQQ